MLSPAERNSTRFGRVAWTPLALVLACCAAPVRAQAPSCAWEDGVTLPVSGVLGLLIASDGGAGVLAFTWPWASGPVPHHGVVRMFHVLEQGVLDPSLPPSGVPVLSGADLSGQVQLYVLRAIPDGSGGMYLLTRTCDALQAHVLCFETSQVRLQHVTAQGTPTPGWPALGHLIPYRLGPSPLESVDIVSDGSGGIIAAWLDGTVWNGTAPIMAQRFAADGTTLWPGGTAGLNALTSTFTHRLLRIAGDGTGGVVAIASRRLNAIDENMELVACRVDAAGALAWGAEGKPVLLQPGYSSFVRGVSVDAQGRSFVSANLVPLGPGPAQFFTQSLTPAGARAWGLFGVSIGESGGGPDEQLLIPSGFMTVHCDPSGLVLFQLQDEFGAPMLGSSAEGMPADWSPPWTQQSPMATSEGHVITVWSSGSGPDPPDVRALELDESGSVAPGWPASGAQVCAPIGGHELGNAFVAAGHLFVGSSTSGFFGTMPRVHRLSRAVLAVEPRRPRAALLLSPPSPNPSWEAWSLRFELAEASAVTLEVLDIVGRRVLREDLGGLAAGPQVVPVPRGASLAPGVYLLRLAAAGQSDVMRVVKLR